MSILIRDAKGRTLLQMRDSAAPSAALLWGFWGGAVDPDDENAAAAAARELNEELGVTAQPDDFEFLTERRDSRGRIAHLLLYRPALDWPDICVNEGAGAAFFWRGEIALLPVAASITWHLQRHPDVFADDGAAL